MLRPRDADAGGPERPAAATTFFGALDPAAQAAFLGLGREAAFAARSTIFLRGDASDCVYFVRSGRIDVCISSPAGRRLVVTHIDADELLGELSMFDGGVRNVDAVAATDVSLLAILREDLVDFLSLRPDAAMAMIMGLCGRARSVLATFEILAQGNAQARLAGCLRLMAEKWGEPDAKGGIRITEPLSQNDLAGFSGLTRESVNRLLRQMNQAGIVCLDGRTIVIAEPELLNRLAEA